MSVPKQRQTHGRSRRRRAHHSLSGTILSACKKCGAMVRQHNACAKCGTYKGRQVVDLSKQATKKSKKAATKN